MLYSEVVEHGDDKSEARTRHTRQKPSHVCVCLPHTVTCKTPHVNNTRAYKNLAPGFFLYFHHHNLRMSTIHFARGATRAIAGEMALKALTNDLSEPVPLSCAELVIGAMTLLAKNHPATEADNMEDTDYLQRLDHTLYILTIWYSFRRTRAQVEAVLSLTCTCSPQHAASHLHQVGVSSKDRSLYNGPGRLSEKLLVHMSMEILRHAHERRLADAFLHHIARRKSWPYNIAQISVHDTSPAGYLDWMVANEMLIFLKVLDLLAYQMSYGWTLIARPSIKQHLYLTPFVEATERWCHYVSDLEQGYIQDDDNEAAILIVGIFLLMSVTMWTITSGCSDHTAAAFYLRERRKDMLVACDRMIIASISLKRRVRIPMAISKCKQIIEYARLIGTTIYNLFPRYRSLSRTSLVSHESHRLFMRDALSLTVPHVVPWARFVDNLNYCYIRQRFSAPGCVLTPDSDQRGRRFRYCAGCERIPYCSRACQKKAWRCKDAAGLHHLQHRDVYALIRQIWSRYNVPHLDLSKLRHGEIPIIHPPTLSEEETQTVIVINEHFVGLTMYELES